MTTFLCFQEFNYVLLKYITLFKNSQIIYESKEKLNNYNFTSIKIYERESYLQINDIYKSFSWWKTADFSNFNYHITKLYDILNTIIITKYMHINAFN